MVTDGKVALITEYNGARYCGFQLQANGPTIQGEIEQGLRKLTGGKIRVAAAGRTDAGVHARGQVVSFRTKALLPLEAFVKGLNYYLPEDIVIKGASRVDDSFDVRRSAVSREYRYCILNNPARSPLKQGFAYLVTAKLDTRVMKQACRGLIGRHDFASFVTGDGSGIKSTIRNVYNAEIEKKGELVIFNIAANSFLPHQVRNTVGALVRIGLSKITVDEFNNIVQARKPGLARPTAPACGLCLMRINYPEPFGGETWGDIS
ncbi:tRNA pseudouridine(38-40) synthase TruA [Chloroflexota bacterium]